MMKVRLASILMVLMLVTLFLSQVPITSAATTAKDVRVHLSGPSVLGTENIGHYSAPFVDPQGRDWSYLVFITADNTTGASPLERSPVTGNLTSTNRSFEFDITAPRSAGEITIHVNCSSKTGDYVYIKTETIEVVSPVIIHAVVQNPTDFEMYNSTVRFFVDDEIIDQQTITVIPPGQFQDITAEWISADKTPGSHSTRVEIDLNGDGVIDTSSGDRVITDKFYIEGGTSTFVTAIIGIGLLALIAGIYLISKRKMK